MSGEQDELGDLWALTLAVSSAIVFKASGEVADTELARGAVDNAEAKISRFADPESAENARAICAAYRILLDEVDIMEPTGVRQITDLLTAARRSVILPRGLVVAEERGNAFRVVTVRLDIGEWGCLEESFDFPPGAPHTPV
jgi:hypothetical protein